MSHIKAAENYDKEFRLLSLDLLESSSSTETKEKKKEAIIRINWHSKCLVFILTERKKREKKTINDIDALLCSIIVTF